MPTNATTSLGEISQELSNRIRSRLEHQQLATPQAEWQAVCQLAHELPLKPSELRILWQQIFTDESLSESPMWWPTKERKQAANLTRWMQKKGHQSYAEFHRWSAENRADFWMMAVNEMDIVFANAPDSILDNESDSENPIWLPGASMNIVNSCFQTEPESTAIVVQKPGQSIQRITNQQLRQLTNRVANSIVQSGYQKGDALAVVLPMTAESVAIYLGIVSAGCAVVSIADSFAAPEIANRLKIANAKAVFTYDVMLRGGKPIPLYDRVCEATDLPIITLSSNEELSVELRDHDSDWNDFLVNEDQFEPVVCRVDDPINVLFSSGTTGDPKAIPWTHLTPIKCAVDGLMHQDIHPEHVVAWPTNLGWMMGPWLIFASLMNRASIALYEDVPMGEGFGKFVQDAKVNMLGVVPTIVKAWRKSACMERFDWSAIYCFSSTGEASGGEDMFYLSSLAGMRPIIEYCGGTEIGGGYITSTVIQPNVSAAFSTAAAGLDFVILDLDGKSTDDGELFLVPPSMGLSQRLLNRDHHQTYFEDVPRGPAGEILRRHGDHMKRLSSGYYVAGGRVDDTMNLGGIKISSAEIERVLNQVDGVKETAAVAFTDQQGPNQLAVFAVTEADDSERICCEMNSRIKKHLNPLFKVQQLKIVDQLPRTASGKVMRRKLRDRL